jgi:hypothetical protein
MVEQAQQFPQSSWFTGVVSLNEAPGRTIATSAGFLQLNSFGKELSGAAMARDALTLGLIGGACWNFRSLFGGRGMCAFDFLFSDLFF